MITWLYCQCGDEDQMMPYFMRWYAPQVDRLIMLDGGMTDKTRAVILEYPNAEIQPHPFTPDNFDDDKYIGWISEKYHDARGRADWVIIVDADEFLHTGRPLRQSLIEYSLHDIRAVQCRGYQMAAEYFPTRAGQLPDIVNFGAADKIYDKVCCFDPVLSVKYSVGRHSAMVKGYTPERTGMKLLHYRYFGDEYTTERNSRNHRRRSADDIATGRGYQADPGYLEGKYSLAWYKQILLNGHDVVSEA